jgi:hypothetical protein
MKRLHWLTVTLLLTAVTACGDSSPAATSLDGPVMRYPAAAPAEGGNDAEIRGRLELDGDCLYVALDEIGERYPIVWPAGTTWDVDSQNVISQSGVRMAIGSNVYGGGGYRYVADVESALGADAGTRAANCVDNRYGEIAFVNNRSGAIAPAD